VVAQLRDEFVAGRLSHETFMHRMNIVLEARRVGELPPLVADLPAPAPGGIRRVTEWISATWSRLAGQAARPGTERGRSQPAPGPARAQAPLMTAGMQAAPDRQLPVPLRFPRGTGEQFSIGRDASCDLAIADMTVSRRHATLERTADGWLLTDLESTNGTRVNGWRVRGKVQVRAGDLVTFGNAQAVFARGDDPAETRDNPRA
jgi:hypothetical protein